LTASRAPPDTGGSLTNHRDDTVRVRLRYPDLDTFVEKYAPNVTRGGIFLASRDPRPVGQVLRFEVLLRQGGPVLSGQGRVTWVKEFNAAEPHRPYGMGVQFIQVDSQARPVLDRLLQRKLARSSPEQPTFAAPRIRTDLGRPTERTPVLGEENEDELDDTALRRTLERARALSARTDDLEALLAADPEPPATLAQALDDLPRLLAGKRPTGQVRLLPDALEATHPKKDEAS
jgi:uncharacterized protein (TIGR02266 family)